MEFYASTEEFIKVSNGSGGKIDALQGGEYAE
jgi:hypothetical protein